MSNADLPSSLQYALKDDGDTIAYHYSPGRCPGIIFFTGYKSDMMGSKAICLETFARERGNAFLRFDYTGHGRSSGEFLDGTIGRWADDAIFALDCLTEGPQILVGSSLGGWIMLLVARARPHRIAAMLGVASAPDFTEDLILPLLSPADHDRLDREGVVPVYSPYDPEPTPVTRRILTEGRNHLVLHQRLALHCPIRLIHGMSDTDVPWRTSMRLSDALQSTDVEITLVKSGDHRLSQPHDLRRLTTVLESLLRHIGSASP